MRWKCLDVTAQSDGHLGVDLHTIPVRLRVTSVRYIQYTPSRLAPDASAIADLTLSKLSIC